MIDRFLKKQVVNLQPYMPHDYDCKYKLDANESPFNLSEKVRQNVLDRISSLDFMIYPDTNSDALREAIAQHNGVDVKKVVVGNGSDEMIHVLLNTFVDKSDFVLSHRPTFSMYGLNTEVLGGNYEEIPTDEDFNIDVDLLIEKANDLKAKVVILCNPNNPTGKLTPKAEILRLVESTDSIIMVDEAYIEFGGESVVGEVEKYDRLIVSKTFSKAFGAAAIRTGYLISTEEIVNKILAVKAPYNLNAVSQIVAEEILKDTDYIKENVEKILSERNRVFEEMSGIEKLKVYETGANFILFKVEDSRKVFEGLLDRGVMVRFFGGGVLENHLRVSIGTAQANDQFLKGLKEVI